MTTDLKVKSVAIDNAAIARASDQYLKLREQLTAEALTEVENVLTHFPVDPRTAKAEQAWQVMWNKPLFANTKVEI